jgi:hypothetical protein
VKKLGKDIKEHNKKTSAASRKANLHNFSDSLKVM